MNEAKMIERQVAKKPSVERQEQKQLISISSLGAFSWLLGVLAFILSSSLQAAPTTSPTTQPRGGSVIPPDKREVPGLKFAIAEGEIYVPTFYKPGKNIDVVVWFLGAPWVVEQEFYDAHKNAVLFVASPQTLQNNFPGPQYFRNLLGNVELGLQKKGVIPEKTNVPFGKICLASFSNGYTAVRQILTFEDITAHVSDVVLCDSLYATRVAGANSELDDLQMAPFLDYARRAAAGEKNFLFSQLYPPEEQYRGNTTTQTALYLIHHVGAKIVQVDEKTSRGIPIVYRADMNGFHVCGYAGMTNQDHFEHLFCMHELLKRTSLDDAK
jgi:hypothetical protein